MLRRFLFTLLCAAVAAPTFAQTIRNPRSVTFPCPDHTLDDGHEIDVIRLSDNTLVQTIQGLDPASSGTAAMPDGSLAPKVTVTINMQPINFGSYYFIVRSLGAGVKSDNSPNGPSWQRVPGSPGSPIPGGI